MASFKQIYARAAKRKGGEAALEKLVAGSKPKSKAALKKIGDDRYLSEMTKRIFQAGFVWRVVEAKWPDFEEAFRHFDVGRMAMLSDENLDELGRDTRIIRHAAKIAAVRHNAIFLSDLAKEHGSAAKFFADWPSEDIVSLWAVLKKRGARLGGYTGPYFLRFMGKDSFLLSPDVTAALIRAKGRVGFSADAEVPLACSHFVGVPPHPGPLPQGERGNKKGRSSNPLPSVGEGGAREAGG